MAKQVRRQHTVSRFYLNGFSSAEGQIQQYWLKGSRSHKSSINDASVIKDFYSVEVSPGQTSDYFERRFAEIEAPAATALKSILAGVWPMTVEVKESLAVWIALQHLRTEGIRNGQAEVRALLYRLVIGTSGKARLKKLIEEREGVQVEEDRLDAEWREITQPGGPKLQADSREHIRQIAELLPGTTRMFTDMQWSIDLFNRRSLLTCDHPVALLPYPEADWWDGVGLASAAGFAIPLSRHVGLVISRPTTTSLGTPMPDLQIPGSTKLADSINQSVLTSARQRIYHHPGDGELLERYEMPAERSREFDADAGADLISEEGLFGAFKPSSAFETTRGSGGGRGVSISDIEWPIPGRTFTWPGGNSL